MSIWPGTMANAESVAWAGGEGISTEWAGRGHPPESKKLAGTKRKAARRRGGEAEWAGVGDAGAECLE
jgi:hypothetical protein